MDGECGERSREGAGAKGQMRGRSLHYGRVAFPALMTHGEGGLHRHHGAIRRFVRARARADIEHGVRVAESAHDRGRDARVRTAVRAVATADLVVELRRGHPPP
jgi:hypothetical protein